MSDEELVNVIPSEEESETEDDPSKHDELLAKISKLGGKRTLKQREEPSTVVSEFHLSNSKEYRVGTDDLLAALSNKKGVRTVKTRLAKVDNKTAHLLKPLSSAKKDKLQRKIAFEESSAKVSKWESIVRHNRKAEHLKFPLQAEVPPRPSLSARVESFEPRTPMELEVAAVLRKSQHDLPSDQELTVSEQKALLKLSLEEAKERRAELRKMRSLISAYEQKQRRVNRIKSKKFHKVQRKLNEKRNAKKGEGEEGNEDRLQKAERLRAKERATLKHSRLSKWAKEQITRKHRDSSVRNALVEQSDLKKELKQKNTMVEEEESSSDEGSVVTESDGEVDPTPFVNDPSNPWLRQEDGRTNRSKHMLSLNQRKGVAKGGVANFNEDDSEDELSTVLKEQSKSVIGKEPSGILDTHNFMKSSGHMRNTKLAMASDNLLAVQEAFAGDDVVEEFLKEKKAAIEDDTPKIVDLRLPGWGSWAGEGIKERKTSNQLKETAAAPEECDDDTEGSDTHLKYVIINHKRDKKAAKHMVSSLPYPMNDSLQFKKTMAAPVGRHWNTETRFNEMIRPKIQTSIGSVIQPMRLTDEVREFMHDSARERRKRFSVDKK